jgi:hypothetical protein
LITLALAVDPVLAADLSRLCGSSVWESVRASVGECLRTWYAATNAHHKQCALAAMLATGSAEIGFNQRSQSCARAIPLWWHARYGAVLWRAVIAHR